MAPETLTLSVSPAAGFGPSSGLRELYHASDPQDQVIRSTKTRDDFEAEVKRPSIKFQPVQAEYEARSERILANLPPGATLPKEYPKEVTGERLWIGKEVGGVDAFAVQLSSAEIEEIENALKEFKGKSFDLR